MKLSVVVSAYNEAHRIEKCLKSVSFADEIVVIDNSSTDNTAKIAKQFGAKVYTRPNNPMLNVNKNFGFDKAIGDWILCLDADETITPELEKEIKGIISIDSRLRGNDEGKNEDDRSVNGYWIPRKNIIFGKWIQNSIWWPDYQLRLFKKGSGKFPEKHVHEMLEIEGQKEKLHEPMVHDNYSSISQYLYKLDKIYTENEAANILQSGRKLTWIDAISFPVDDFLKTFFARKGYKDGLHGLVLSILQAFYAEIVFAKVWEKQGFEDYNNKHFLQDVYKASKKVNKEVHYWFLTSFIEETRNIGKKIVLKIKRRLG
jgi:glycosyltransferase involved in cell wall biosynthesis